MTISGLLIIAEYSGWLDKKFDRISDALILACLCFKKSGTSRHVKREILQSFGDNVTEMADILNDEERYLQVIAPKLYEIVTSHALGKSVLSFIRGTLFMLLAHDYTLPKVDKLQWLFLKYCRRAGMPVWI